MTTTLLERTDAGIYCPPGDFFVDPWTSVPRAVITHGHADHVRAGCDRYLCAARSEPILRTRLGGDAELYSRRYGEKQTINGVQVSFHPAGHILGSAQVRMDYRGHVAVVTGDYKRQADATCEAYEPLACHLLVTESTFGLPIYRWPEADQVATEINAWWKRNIAAEKTCVLLAYALGKAQRVLSLLDADLGPIHTHGAVESLCEVYRAAGVRLPRTERVGARRGRALHGALIIAPPSAGGTPWMRRFTRVSRAMASGWMRIRGARRRRAMDRGFVLSDHADWPALLRAIHESKADIVWTTHGCARPLARYLREQGGNARALATPYRDAVEDDASEENDT